MTIFKPFFLHVLYLILCSQKFFLFTNAMVGEGVRYAEEGEYDFIVGIKRYNFGNPETEKDHVGTGSLISPQDVLTLSQVLNYVEPDRYEVVVGSNDLRFITSHDPIWWLDFDNYAQSNRKQKNFYLNDVCIIRLMVPVRDSIPIGQVASITGTSVFNSDVVLVGWGVTYTNEMCRFKQVGKLQIISHTACINKVEVLTETDFNLPHNFICAIGDPFLLSTTGHNGGPILYGDQIIAIQRGTAPNFPDSFDSRKLNIQILIGFYKKFIRKVLSFS